MNESMFIRGGLDGGRCVILYVEDQTSLKKENNEDWYLWLIFPTKQQVYFKALLYLEHFQINTWMWTHSG